MPWNRILTIVALAFFVTLGLITPRLPAPVPATAPAAEFSSERALRHVAAIAQRPHPVGSSANEQARLYIADQITRLGLMPLNQGGTGLRRNGAFVLGARVNNVMTRLPGTANTKAVLLLGHYDSVANGPGASDDGHAAGVLLETMRILKAGPPLRNDVVFLFTDGEEADLLGAEAFVADRPWEHEIGVALNFEARGTKGFPTMFETSDGNGRLIREFARAAPHPYASSFTYEIYKRLPNDTDLTVFKRRGFAGLNFAFIDNFLFYHTPYDDPAHLDPGAVQQQGGYALSLARQFGNEDLSNLRAENAVYFYVPAAGLFVYPVAWVWPLIAIALLAVVAAIGIGFRSGALNVSRLMIGLVVFPLVAAVAPALAVGIWIVMRGLHPSYTTFLQGDVYNHNWYLAAFEMLALALAGAILTWRQHRGDSAGFAAGALIWAAVLNVIASAAAPGASYLLTWPVLFAAIALAASAGAGRSPRPIRLLSVLLCAAVPVLLIAPLIQQLYVALGMGATAPATLFCAILLGLLAPQLGLLISARSNWLPIAAGAGCAACLIGAGVTSRFDIQHPRQSSVFYALDAGTGKAVWASSDAVPDEWTSQFLGAAPQRSEDRARWPLLMRPIIQHDAPALGLAPPELSVTGDDVKDGLRTLRAMIDSPRLARVVTIFASSDTPILSGSADERAWDAGAVPANRVTVHFEAFAAAGIPVSFTLQAGHALKLRIVDETSGLPDIPGFTYRPRPAWMIRGWSYPFGESTTVSKDFTIESSR